MSLLNPLIKVEDIALHNHTNYHKPKLKGFCLINEKLDSDMTLTTKTSVHDMPARHVLYIDQSTLILKEDIDFQNTSYQNFELSFPKSSRRIPIEQIHGKKKLSAKDKFC